MKKYTPDELAEVLHLHKLWVMDEEGGQRAYLQRADLRGAYLRGADLQGADLQGADLRGADLQGADLRGAYLQRADLRGAYLRGAYLRHADLRGADLQDASLRGAYLQDASLRGAYLQGANLRHANLQDADLQDAYLRHADLQDAYLQGADGDKMKIASLCVFTGLYPYQCWAVVAEDGSAWVRMGCLWKSIEEWDRIGIRNSNKSEFPDDHSEKCERRVRAFEFTRAEAMRTAEKVKERVA